MCMGGLEVHALWRAAGVRTGFAKQQLDLREWWRLHPCSAFKEAVCKPMVVSAKYRAQIGFFGAAGLCT